MVIFSGVLCYWIDKAIVNNFFYLTTEFMKRIMNYTLIIESCACFPNEDCLTNLQNLL